MRWLAAAVVLLAACGSGRRSEPLAGPIALRSAEEAQGRRLWFHHCDMCHPGGAAGLGPSLNDKPAPRAAIKLQVREGMGAMPSFSDKDIPGPELEALVAYVIAMRR